MVTLAFHSLHFSPMFGDAGRPAEEIITATAAAGFGAIGLDLAVIGEYEHRRAPAGTLAAELRDTGLRCTDVLPFFAEAGNDPRVPAAELADLAADFGAPLVVGSVPGSLEWPVMVEHFGTAAQVLAERGVRMAVEYIPHSGLPTLANAVRLCAELGWERAGVVLDSYHSLLGGATVEEIGRLTANQIALVQYSDARTTQPVDRPDESRNHRRVPGEGMLPLADWVAAVRATGYDGVVAAEVLSSRLRTCSDLVAAISRCRDVLRHDWQAGDS